MENLGKADVKVEILNALPWINQDHWGCSLIPEVLLMVFSKLQDPSGKTYLIYIFIFVIDNIYIIQITRRFHAANKNTPL